MARYIDADDIENITVFLDTRKRLKKIEAPICDVQKVKHAQNISEFHPVDEFVCSNCHINLEGWTRKYYDDDGEDFYQEYIFKYCPNCGAKMDGKDE